MRAAEVLVAFGMLSIATVCGAQGSGGANVATPGGKHSGSPSDYTRQDSGHDSGDAPRSDSKRGSGANDDTPVDPRHPAGSVDAHDSEIHRDADDQTR